MKYSENRISGLKKTEYLHGLGKLTAALLGHGRECGALSANAKSHGGTGEREQRVADTDFVAARASGGRRGRSWWERSRSRWIGAASGMAPARSPSRKAGRGEHRWQL